MTRKLCLLAAFVLVTSQSWLPRPSRAAADLRNGEFTSELEGVRIRYAVYGRGPVMMVVPNAWGLTYQGLRALYRDLEDGLTFIYFDPRGMGGSAPITRDEDMSMGAVRRDLENLRRKLELGKVHAIGWSNGGFNLLVFAAEHPDALETATILHSSANFSQEDSRSFAEKYPELMRRFQSHQAALKDAGLSEAEQNVRHKAFIINEWFPLMFSNRERGKEILRSIYAGAGFSFRHGNYSMTVDAKNLDARPLLGRIRCRMLLVAGAHDMLPADRVADAHQAIPGSRFEVFEHSAHFAPLEEPERFRSVLLDFIQ